MRPTNGLMYVAPAFAANSAWFDEKQSVTLVLMPSLVSVLTATSPSGKRGIFTTTLGALAASLAGSNIIGFQGGAYGELEWHPALAVLDDDIAGIIGRFIEGVLVNEETLAIDLIKAVGPIPGMYLDKAHTRQWWQKEQFIPKAADRLTYPEWMEKGKKSALDYAQDRVEEILATHKPKPLTASQDEEIERILAEARAYYKKRGLI